MDALLLSHGADLPWLTGYRAMPLERLTMLVLPATGDAVLVVPALEAPRVAAADQLFSLLPWTDVEDPLELVTSLLPGRRWRAGCAPLAISDRAWTTTVLALQRRLPDARWIEASTVTSPIRAVKDASELDALRLAGAAADRVAAVLQAGEIPLVGRTEAAVSARIAALLIEEGHQQVNFAIVGSGPNAASPHHEPGWSGHRPGRDRGVRLRRLVLARRRCRLLLGHHPHGGHRSASARGRRSATRCCWPPSSRRCRRPASGVTAEHVDRVARQVIEDAGFGDLFVHRTGHGIGIEEHEDPYLVAGNTEHLRPGPCLLGGAGHLLAGPVRHAARGHRGHRRGRRARAAQRGRPRSRRRRRIGGSAWTWASRARWRWWWPGPGAWVGPRPRPWPPKGCG